MGNADDCLKVKADWITSDVCDDGLKKAIEYSEDVYLKTLIER